MAYDHARIQQLREKYGAKTIDSAAARNPQDLLQLIEWADELDPHYAKLWLDFTHGMCERGVLDERTRCLVVVGQMVAMDEMEELPCHIRGALTGGATPPATLDVPAVADLSSPS